MADFEAEGIKTLFHDADLEHVPTTRDLIGPAVAWGSNRRRRDRWTAAGAAGAVAAVAAVGVVALRPGGGTRPDAVPPGGVKPAQTTAKPHPPAPATTTALPKLSGTLAQREQQLLDALTPYLPPGDRITCQPVIETPGFCTTMTLTGPDGTSIVQLVPGDRFIQPAPVDAKYIHPHKPTAAIPLVSGTKAVPGGTVQVQSTDTEARVNIQDTAALTDPSALSFHTAQYVFTPHDSGASWAIELSELVTELPWKGGSQIADEHVVFGFNRTGPVLSPEQFAALVSAPIFPSAMQQLADLRIQAQQNETQNENKPQH